MRSAFESLPNEAKLCLFLELFALEEDTQNYFHHSYTPS